jgi:hypothetical protein
MRAICRRFLRVPSLLALVLLGAPLTIATAPPARAQAADIYASASNWLCRPDKSDPCDSNLNATVVQANGQMSVERWAPNAGAPIDCFYVYPTSSWDNGDNSDRRPGTNEEVFATRTQAARFGSQCRLYVPIYRSVTSTWFVNAFLTASSLEFPDDILGIAYDDVLAAFRHYLSVDNGGRGFVLIGHSQGSQLLSRLVTEEIGPDPAAKDRLVSALLIGLPAVSHPAQSLVPSCTSASQTGCHITYNSFRATSPPAADSVFGASGHPEDCTNPAALGGGPAVLTSYFPTAGYRWQTTGRLITTPFVTLPGLVEGQCVSGGGLTYFSITVNGRPADPRTDDIPGDPGFGLEGDIGLHYSDVQLALGNLVTVVGQQSTAYRTR